ncbi:hypothetical protein E1281_12420 [Actinomadura sp. KC345]|uniref:hypothetical protein n=1 Tax=Actinomadura sp. KC345 TaxID=2530371 RepID=UPI00104445CE|nr:hypothetical protein [Actinomadura sp. KC345]TDC55456.1 hypothetical protein E1281_12420 [Actinomadura sp. KC345]
MNNNIIAAVVAGIVLIICLLDGSGFISMVVGGALFFAGWEHAKREWTDKKASFGHRATGPVALTVCVLIAVQAADLSGFVGDVARGFCFAILIKCVLFFSKD